MALLWIDGFDSYGTTTGAAPSPTGVLARQYTVNNEASIDIEDGRLGSGYSLEIDSTAWIATPALTTNDTIIVGLAFKIADSDDADIIQLYDGGTLGVNLVYDNGIFSIYRGSTLLESIPSHIKLNAWYWLELKVKSNDTTGTYEIRLGETNILSGSGIDTKISTNAYHDIVRPGDNDVSIDDLYICDGAGATNNDFLGNVKVQTLLPSGAGTTTQFTPLAGNNYAAVDEEIIDDDTTYVESLTAAHKDTYAYGNLAAGIASIKGIQIDTCCRETDASSFDLITPIRSGATDYDDVAQTIGTTDYIVMHRVAELDPFTSAAWTETNINAAEFGIKVG